jgi:putative transposase
MARLARLVAPGLPHLIVHRGHNGQAVFTDDGDRALYRQALSEAAAAARVALHGYALLPGEVRLLVTPDSVDALGSMMQSLGRSFVRAFNLKHQRTSTPWEGRFRSTVIEAERHFLSCLRFAEAVDLAGMALAQPQGVPSWSSAAHHLGLSTDPLVTEHGAFWTLGNTPFEREAAYRRRLEQALPHGEVVAIAAAVLKGWPLGSPEFAERIADLTGRRTQPLPKGRPRRAKTSLIEAPPTLSVPIKSTPY